MLGIAEDSGESEVAPSVPELQSTKSPTKGSPTKKPITNGLAESDDDSDDEPVLRTKIYKKKRHVLEDSDSDADEPATLPTTTKLDANLDSNDGQGEDVPDEIEDQSVRNLENRSPTSLKKKRIANNSDSDSDSDLEEAPKENKGPNRFNLDSGPDSEPENVKSPKKSASGSSSSSSEDEEESKEPLAWGSGSSDDEPGELSEALKKKLAKGAAKTESGGSRKGQSRKSKTDAMTEIHAETQRLIRESEVRLPYHKPTPLGLSAILERTKKKQESLKDLKRSWKTPPVVQNCTTTTPSLQKTKAVDEMTGASPNLTKPIVIEDKQIEEPTTDSAPMEEENEDVLPDITTTPLCERLQAKNISTEAIKSTEIVQTLDEKLKAAEKKPEQDSGFISTSCHTSEEENSSDPPNKKTDNQERGSKMEDSPLCKSGSEISDEQVEKTPVSDKKATGTLRRTALTPRLASLGVSLQKPRLSGGPDTFIDFDVCEKKNTPKPGVRDLMDRLMKHSAGRKKKGAQDIEMSTVQKVQTENDGEELQLKKFVVHLDGDEGEPDKTLNKPGAKLTNLKESLAEKMKAKREEARRQRCEMFALDNEEGFEDEEEAELTDQSDTDEEEEEEMAEDEEEEMDEDEYTTKEKERMSNPFLNDEAEEEDELEEGDLHLRLNEEVNEETETSDEPPRKPAKTFLNAALKKTNTLQLFDDDAISESPTLSQSANKENIEVSERPFEQLSGETVKLSQKNQDDDLDDIDGDMNNDADDDINMLTLDDEDDDNMYLKLENPNLSLLRDKDGSVGTDADSSYDTLIPPGQGTAKKNRSKDCHTPDLFTPSSKSSMATNSTYAKSVSKLTDLPMPIEDSQDLLGSPLQCSQAESTPRNKTLGSFSFNLDESTTCSHMLDEEGLLKEKSSGKKQARRQLMLEGDSDGEDDAELLGLCSGKFSLSQGTQDKPKSFADIGGIDRLMDESQSTNDDILGLCSGRFSSTTEPVSGAAISKGLELGGTQATQGNMSELLGLCSGQFTGEQSEQSQSPPPKPIFKKKKKRRVIADDDDDEFEVSEARGTGPGMDEVNLDSDEEVHQPQESDSSDDEEMVLAKKINKKKELKKPKLNLKNFVDAEAELSGSEYDSDENYDIDEKDDILERCSGDEEDFDDEQLQEQVGRVHLKKMIDEDKRDIRLMQEMYLPDGDLYSEGGGRMRRFRWKNIDEESQQDMFQASDEEAEEDNLEAQKWRLERHEREKFLLQQKEEEESGDKEPEPQKIKFGRAAFKPKRDMRKVLEACSQGNNNNNDGATFTLFKVPKSSHGSFLNRGRDTLAKIAEYTKPASASVGGSRSSKGFVFSSLAEDGKSSEGEAKKPPVRRSMSTPAPNQPASKKPRLEKASTVPHKKSIFNHL